jgi:predicted GH43/DUF377 family glycosyl hydrolase
MLFRIIFCFISTAALSAEWLDLEEMSQSFVLETRRIEIPGHPYAFNPSMIRWNDRILMSFRILPGNRKSFSSLIGVIWLDANFNPVSEAQILDLRASQPDTPSRAEDARLVAVGQRLYMVYDDNVDPKVTKGGFRLYVAELITVGSKVFPINIDCMASFEGESKSIREKAWVPFDYRGNLLLAYSLMPHRIFKPLLGRSSCETIAQSSGAIDWDLGILRGGTPALFGVSKDDEYLAFFHSSRDLATLHSNGKEILHYFMGAYTFESEPPFAIKKISPEPIIGKNFYRGETYQPYWKPISAVFPCGYIADGDFLWICYGRQDHETWIAKLDKKGLLNSLIPVLPAEKVPLK